MQHGWYRRSVEFLHSYPLWPEAVESLHRQILWCMYIETMPDGSGNGSLLCHSDVPSHHISSRIMWGLVGLVGLFDANRRNWQISQS
jgi:hypothetical protein